MDIYSIDAMTVKQHCQVLLDNSHTTHCVSLIQSIDCFLLTDLFVDTTILHSTLADYFKVLRQRVTTRDYVASL